MAKGMYLQTTEVPAIRSMGEIQSALIQAGARKISQEFDDDGRVSGMAFSIIVHGAELPFRLPVRTPAVFAKLQAERAERKRPKLVESIAEDRERAERIAWRQLLYWVKAQLALIDTGMVQPAEVFLGYIALRGGKTMFEQMAASEFKMLPGPEHEDADQ